MSEEIKKNIGLCDEILDRFSKLNDSNANDPITWQLMEDTTDQTEQLKILYQQIIPKQ